MEYYGNTLCVSYGELVDNGIISPSNYKLMAYRGNLNVVRRGGGSSGSCALIAVDSLPTRYREKVEEQFPDGPKSAWRDG